MFINPENPNPAIFDIVALGANTVSTIEVTLQLQLPHCWRFIFQGKRGKTIDRMDIAELAAHLEIERFAVVGYSSGGPHALAVAGQGKRTGVGVF